MRRRPPRSTRDRSSAASDVYKRQGAGRLSAIDLGSGEKTVLASELPLNVPVILAPQAVGMPAGVAVAADGTIYVSCAGDNSIRKITVGSN